MKARVCGRCGTIVLGVCTCKSSKQSSHSKGYNSKWRRFRERLYKLRCKTGVLCAMCGLAFGSDSPHADHIVPVQSNDDPLFFEPNNIQFLHPECHASKTVQDVRQGLTR